MRPARWCSQLAHLLSRVLLPAHTPPLLSRVLLPACLAPQAHEANLKKSSEYHLKETETQLARQTHTKAHPKGMKPKGKSSGGAKGKSKSSAGAKKSTNPKQVSVTVEKDEAGCSCVVS